MKFTKKGEKGKKEIDFERKIFFFNSTSNKNKKFNKMFGKSSEKFLIISVLAIIVIDSCSGSTFITPPITHPAHPGQCFEPVTMQVVQPGQNIYLPVGCMRLTCLPNFSFAGDGCSPQEAIGQNCREVVGDREQTYPNCCPHYVCDDDQDNELFEYGTNSL